jgi:hypothetical protein
MGPAARIEPVVVTQIARQRRCRMAAQDVGCVLQVADLTGV